MTPLLRDLIDARRSSVNAFHITADLASAGSFNHHQED